MITLSGSNNTVLYVKTWGKIRVLGWTHDFFPSMVIFRIMKFSGPNPRECMSSLVVPVIPFLSFQVVIAPRCIQSPVKCWKANLLKKSRWNTSAFAQAERNGKQYVWYVKWKCTYWLQVSMHLIWKLYTLSPGKLWVREQLINKSGYFSELTCKPTERWLREKTLLHKCMNSYYLIRKTKDCLEFNRISNCSWAKI